MYNEKFCTVFHAIHCDGIDLLEIVDGFGEVILYGGISVLAVTPYYSMNFHSGWKLIIAHSP